MAFGSFVDIRQQDGSHIRMFYREPKVSTVMTVNWIGITEQMADKFRKLSPDTQKKPM